YAVCFGHEELLRSANDLFYLLKLLALLVDEQLRITDDVDEQDMSDFKFHIGGLLGRHETFYDLKTRDLTSRFGCLCKLPQRNNLFGERFEPRLAAQWIEQRVDSDISYVRTGAILITLFKPAECLLFVAKAEINEGNA